MLDKVIEWASKANYSVLRVLTSASTDEKLGRFFQRKGFHKKGQLIACENGDRLALGSTEELSVKVSSIQRYVYIYELKVGR
ncbi:MAG: hypothetical protein GWO20_19430 [Candidatus Korarchaeota archaeon]|nr:hypothetical protein [Candidatus Korarchaeota archaeon]NIU83650.1 hypothetical protein [Candidatus Thorarchaeota archaeon]NIW15526.1 hypothetical protein [Candidatus Thorarchaeota archaeon]NIW53471.1 hypothetical protein [Candidatus Korarchaeota archaeon]